MNHTTNPQDDRPFREEPTEVLETALDLAAEHARQAARFRPPRPDDALPAVADLFRDELQHREAAMTDSPAPQPAEEPLTHVGWWCWRGDNHGHLATTPCRSDNVPLHAPADWADEMRAVIQRIEDGDEDETTPAVSPSAVVSADRATLRDRIAEALAERFSPGGSVTRGMRVIDPDDEDDPDPARRVLPIEAADAVLAVLPEQADRAAEVERLREEHATWRKLGKRNLEQAFEENARLRAELRRVAAEEQPAETQDGGALMRAHVALAAQAGRDQRAVARVRQLHDALAAETALTSPDDEITRGAAARKIARALDGDRPAVGEQPDTQTREALCRCGHGSAYHDVKYGGPRCRLCPDHGDGAWAHAFAPDAAP
ncbi:hypothetical protein ACIA6D_23355 [Streptomyces cacaoi]